jgi:uracil-DNA glycosylase
MTQDIGDWAPYLKEEKNKDYFDSLLSFLNSRVDCEIFPPQGNMV